MAVSGEFLDFLKDQMSGFAPIEVRRMFSGAGLFRDGRMFALVAGEHLYLKCDAGTAKDFDAENLAPFTYETRTGRKGVMSYRLAPGSCLDDPDEMTRWCKLAWAAALRAGEPKPRPAKRGKASRLRRGPAAGA
jgi:DNA transformation protein